MRVNRKSGNIFRHTTKNVDHVRHISARLPRNATTSEVQHQWISGRYYSDWISTHGSSTIFVMPEPQHIHGNSLKSFVTSTITFLHRGPGSPEAGEFSRRPRRPTWRPRTEAQPCLTFGRKEGSSMCISRSWCLSTATTGRGFGFPIFFMALSLSSTHFVHHSEVEAISPPNRTVRETNRIKRTTEGGSVFLWEFCFDNQQFQFIQFNCPITCILL